MSHFACVLLGDGGGWRIEEVDMDSAETLDDALELIRNFDDPIRILAVEQDDEYAVLVRLDLLAEDDGLLRVFLSNGHAADDYPIAAMFADGLPEIGGDPLTGEDLLDGEQLATHDAAPFGDPDLVEDLGMKAPELIELAVHESTLPIDLIESLCERLGCLDEFEAVRV
jgi:putative tRNA adenosine deaminase-associated protein